MIFDPLTDQIFGKFDDERGAHIAGKIGWTFVEDAFEPSERGAGLAFGDNSERIRKIFEEKGVEFEGDINDIIDEVSEYMALCPYTQGGYMSHSAWHIQYCPKELWKLLKELGVKFKEEDRSEREHNTIATGDERRLETSN